MPRLFPITNLVVAPDGVPILSETEIHRSALAVDSMILISKAPLPKWEFPLLIRFLPLRP